MRWPKLRRLVEDRWSPAVQRRLSLHATTYGNCTCGHAWLTFDGAVVANFCTRAAGNLACGRAPTAASLRKFAALPAGYGEFSRQDAHHACWAYLHELSLPEALADADPLVQALALLDARVGRRRLAEAAGRDLHPLVRRLLELRLEAERAARRPPTP